MNATRWGVPPETEVWKFAEHLGDRRANLKTAGSGEEIIATLIGQMRIVCGHSQPCDLNSRFCRATYCLAVDRKVFDLFFNSEHGYRGHYFRSWHIGLQYNFAVLRSLLPALLGYQHLEQKCDVDVNDSLTSISAKLWLAEVGKGLCPECEGEWKAPSDDLAEIMNGRWEFGQDALSRYGRNAPYLTKVRVFGAFIDGHGNELIPWDKRHRAADIEAHGWS